MRRIEGNPPIIKLDRDEDLWLPATGTQEIIDQMSRGKWKMPESHKFTDMIDPWIRFLDTATEGKKLCDEMESSNVIVGDRITWNTYKRFYSALRDELESDGVPSSKAILGTINSCRKAFLFLLTKEQANELGHKKPLIISNKDIANTKLLVERLSPKHFDSY